MSRSAASVSTAAKLSDAQAQRALDPVLRKIGQTTDPYPLVALAQALQTLAAKLTDAQAQLALYQEQRAQHLADLDKQKAEIRQFVYSEENRTSAKQ